MDGTKDGVPKNTKTHTRRKDFNSHSPAAVTGASQKQADDDADGEVAEGCEKCKSFLARNTDAHVFTVVQQKTYKFSSECIDEFHKKACGLLNRLEGGTFYIELEKGFHKLFLQEIKHKLTEMLPDGMEDMYAFSREGNQISFVVMATERAGRSLCTYDFNVYHPEDAGLKPITRDKFRQLSERIKRQDKFNRDDVLPPDFGKNCSRQVVYCTKDDIETYSSGAGAGETSHDIGTFANVLVRYICYLATQRDGGDIYLGLSQYKEPSKGAQPLGSPPVYKEHDLVWTGQHLCEGFELNGEKRKTFEKQLKLEVDSMHCYSKDNKKIEEVSVTFPPVSCGSANLCLVKINVGYFHGIAWPKGQGPLAYKAIPNGDGLENVKMTFEEWVSSFREPGVQETNEIKDKKSKDTGGARPKHDKNPATATAVHSQMQARKGNDMPPGQCRSASTNNVGARLVLDLLTNTDGPDKVPQGCIDKFHKIVCGLLNSLPGGTICVHLETSSLEVFSHKISGKLTEMLPPGILEADTYVSTPSEKHVFFSVKAAARPLCTYDFKVRLPRDAGLLRPTPDQLFSLITRVDNRPEKYVPVNDPALQKGALLPRYFGENYRREMKSYTRGDVLEFINKGSGKFADTLVNYICALATLKRGGDIYFGVHEHKKLKKSWPSGSPAVGNDVSTGQMLCEGIELTEQERKAFREQLKLEVGSMHCYSKDDKKIEDVSASFLPVSGGSADLCLLKISVGYFHGIAWPKRDYPLAYKVRTQGDKSEIAEMSFEDWIEAFNAQ